MKTFTFSQQLPKPTSVEVGQQWWHQDMVHERPLTIAKIEKRHGCDPGTWNQQVPWAVFRKKKTQPCGCLLNNPSWIYLGCC